MARSSDPRVDGRAPGDGGIPALAVQRIVGDGGAHRGHMLVQVGAQRGMSGRDAVQRVLADLAREPQADGRQSRRRRRHRFIRHTPIIRKFACSPFANAVTFAAGGSSYFTWR
jgi:hypothetical protein